MQWVQPYIREKMMLCNQDSLIITGTVVTVVFLIDVAVTLNAANTLDEPIKQINLIVEGERERLQSYKEEHVFIKNSINSHNEFKHRQKHLLKAYPHLIERKYKGRRRC